MPVRLRLGSAALVAAACLVALALLEVAAYWLMPDAWLSTFHSYRQTALLREPFVYRSDSTLGVDLRPNLGPGVLAGGPVTNEIACLSPSFLDGLRGGAPYQYFAGDSIAFGLGGVPAPYPAVYAELTGRTAMNCGVTRTGQRHQFLKFQRGVAAVGHYPERVFVGYYYANDWWDAAVFPTKRAPDWWLRAEAALRVFLLSYNVVERWVNLLIPTDIPPPPEEEGETPYPYAGMHRLGADFLAQFATHPKLAKNRREILDWARHAREHGYPLVFLLLPNASTMDRRDIYRPMRAWLDEVGVEYLDIARDVAMLRQEQRSLLYGPWDPSHPVPAGHRIFGELVARAYP